MVVNAKKLRTAALLMHFDASWVEQILDGTALLLSDEEKAAFENVDRRGFRADEERKARAAAAVVEEGPVAVAVAGLPKLFSFFTSADFLVVVDQGAPLVERALEFLGSPAGRIEACVARARRRRRHRGPLSLAAGVDADRGLPAGSVDAWSALRASLGPDPVTAVMRGERRAWSVVAGDDREGVVVEGARDAAGARVGACSNVLGTLLLAARTAGGRERMVTMARHLGCDDDEEADALIADLVRDGLLAPPEAPHDPAGV